MDKLLDLKVNTKEMEVFVSALLGFLVTPHNVFLGVGDCL